MESIKELMKIGKEMGLTGKDLQDFISAERDRAEKKEKEERDRAKEEQEHLDRLEKDRLDREERAERRELEKLQVEAVKSNTATPSKPDVNTMLQPRMPLLMESRDQLDSYLARFEMQAKVNKWLEEQWFMCLSNLLTG
ncbi:reverse transcriptase [Plakobranchus ocellatus]|uniref:Reverse transcriptase n=1 Tax=Plakobranchus ocellatus TaxID=259542 RepID=A0AAV3Y681_9GAST|nr:reverse transcriptase [Plakobranchus ocellatus]